MAGIYVVSSVTELSSTTPLLALMLGLAVGIDYSLFIVSRFRRELADGRSGVDAVGRAVGTAGSAVVFAGVTVVIALAALSIVQIPIFTQMGLGASATVLAAVLIAVTLLPAVLGLTGDRLRPRAGGRHEARSGASLGERWGRWVTRRPWWVAIVSVLVLGTAALPALDMQLGLPDDGSAPVGSSQRVAYDRISDAFGPGMNGPLTVVVSTDPGRAPVETKAVQQDVSDLPDVMVAQVGGVNEDGSVGLLTVVPESGPSDPATEDLVTTIREHADGWQEDLGATVQVTGQTALNVDITDRMTAALPVYLAVVVGLALILLMVVFRSLVVPVKAVIGFLLSACVSFGTVVAIFQWGWAADLLGVTPSGTVMVMLPILLVGVLFGLAMDYEVFLVSGMREEHAHGATPRESVVAGMSGGARVVSAAAVIMTAVFAAFVTVDDPTIKPIAVALAVGVLVDAFVVRMTLVPAAMALLGRAAWWFPRRLDRLVPHLDIEGASLETGHRRAAQPAATG
jgi:RND superfamily putative drug exporter